jgi:hypothetical protein
MWAGVGIGANDASFKAVIGHWSVVIGLQAAVCGREFRATAPNEAICAESAGTRHTSEFGANEPTGIHFGGCRDRHQRREPTAVDQRNPRSTLTRMRVLRSEPNKRHERRKSEAPARLGTDAIARSGRGTQKLRWNRRRAMCDLSFGVVGTRPSGAGEAVQHQWFQVEYAHG